MKAYSDIEQSKKLAEILPIESADMSYVKAYFNDKKSDWFIQSMKPIKFYDIIPAWSLAALLNVIPNELKNNEGYYLTLMNDGEWFCGYRNIDGDYNEQVVAKNPIDACCGMIVKLKENNLL